MRIRTSKILFDVLAELNIIVVASIYPAAVADHPGSFTERNSPVLGGAVVIDHQLRIGNGLLAYPANRFQTFGNRRDIDYRSSYWQDGAA
ncbi:hypothetical protein D9M71_700350 [compost metagenome]